MERDAYLEMARDQDQHWWFVGRRRILAELIETLSLPPGARILEIGCGMGGNLEMLRRFGNVTAIEADEFARRWVREQMNVNVLPGMLPDALPDLDGAFDLACLFDVLEHVEADVASLRAIAEKLTPDGRLLVTVPAYQWLWSSHDETLHHCRRYTASRLSAVARDGGLELVRIGYFNTLLFPLAAGARVLSRMLAWRAATGHTMPIAPINRVLCGVLAAEAPIVARGGFPFGVSIFALMRQGT